MWQEFKTDLKERFLKFETFNGVFVFIPWGAGFIYCGLYNLRLGYQYAFVSVGMVLIIWGLRKTFVNRIKQQANELVAVDKRLAMNEEKRMRS